MLRWFDRFLKHSQISVVVAFSMQSKAGEDLFLLQLRLYFYILFTGSAAEPWCVKEGEDWCLGLTHICHLGLCFYFCTDEILKFLCKHLFFFHKFCGHCGRRQPGPQLGGISQALVKEWVQTCSNLATRRKLNTWMWSEKSTCGWRMKQRGKNPLGNACRSADFRERASFP